jgi:Tol biopolymer transport system component/DNA-binding winged helix-turn-helix (wHTH) protein
MLFRPHEPFEGRMSLPLSGVCEFGSFRLDLAERRLLRDGQAVALTPKAYEVLVVLVVRAGHLVTKEEMLQQVWQDTFVDEANLAYNVSTLRKALADDAVPHRYIETVPKRGYRFVALVTPLVSPTVAVTPSVDVLGMSSPTRSAALQTEPPEVMGEPRHARPIRIGVNAWTLGSAAGVLVLAASAWVWTRAGGVDGPAPRLVPLTSLPGDEMRPALSPDGTQVAFFWGGPRSNDGGVYITMIGSPEIRRLTESPKHDNFVQWSPDGRLIAFARYNFEEYAGARIHTVSPLGGPDPKLSDFPARGYLAWSPDGRYIAASRWAPDDSRDETGISLIPLNGGPPRPLTHTRAPWRNAGLAFAPDGRQLAYGSCTPACDLYVLALDASLAPVGPAKRLTTQRRSGIGGVAWARDGQSIIFGSGAARGLIYLSRVYLDRRRPPERIELAGLNAFAPSTARSMDRLVFSRDLNDEDIYRWQANNSAEPVVSSSFDDYDPHFSPGGDRIVFASARSGQASELWVADADGAGAQRLVEGPGAWQSSPQWSPDGQRIAFESVGDDGQFHVWSISARGGIPTRLTKGSGNQRRPSWSRDGKTIYFSADEGSKWDIWRTPLTGGTPERITRTGDAMRGFESADGETLVYQARLPEGDGPWDVTGDGPLLKVPLRGGEPVELVYCAGEDSLAAGLTELFYLDCVRGSAVRAMALNAATGASRVLAALDKFSHGPIAVQPHGVDILYSRWRGIGVDLFLIENFR